MLSGRQIGRLQRAILDSFDEGALRQLLRVQLDADLGRGLQSGGVNELTDADIAELGLTAAEVAELSTLVADLNTFFTVARRGVVARLRNDF